MKINNWIGWNYKSRADEIVDLVLDEVNDMLKKNKLKINYQYNDDNNEGWDYFLELKIHKDECKKRVLQRDFKDRGKSKKQAENDFIKSWNIYYEKINNKRRKNNTDEYIITEKTKINLMIEKLFN